MIRNVVAAVRADVSTDWQQLPIIVKEVKQSVLTYASCWNLKSGLLHRPCFFRKKKKLREGDSQRRRGGSQWRYEW